MHLDSRAHTISLIRHLAALPHAKPHRRQGRMPRPLPSTAIAREYHAAIVRMAVDPAREAMARRAPQIMRLAMANRHRLGHADAAGDDRAQRLIDEAAREAAAGLRPSELHAVALKFGQRADRHAKEQLDRQVRAAIGIPLSAIEKPTRDRIPAFTSANAEMVKTIPDRYFERLRKDVAMAFESGETAASLAERFVEVDGMSDRDAERLARDQIGRLTAQVNHDRLEGLGVTRAIWRTMNDERVCDECQAKDGQEFDLADGIDDCVPGECHPMDRCYSEPVLGDLLGEDA